MSFRSSRVVRLVLRGATRGVRTRVRHPASVPKAGVAGKEKIGVRHKIKNSHFILKGIKQGHLIGIIDDDVIGLQQDQNVFMGRKEGTELTL